MKALIISDIHANICALQAIWSKERDSDVIYCAGDLVDYGPFPKEVIAWAREHNIVCVKGNHDKAVVAAYHGESSWRETPVEERKWSHNNALLLEEDDIAYLESLPESLQFTMDGCGYSLQHMYIDYETIEGWEDFNAYWRRRTESPLQDCENKRLIFGHTHRRRVHYLSERELWLNPGSVSYPRDDNIDGREAHYMTITDGKISMHSAAYDLSRLLWAIDNAQVGIRHRNVCRSYFC